MTFAAIRGAGQYLSVQIIVPDKGQYADIYSTMPLSHIVYDIFGSLVQGSIQAPKARLSEGSHPPPKPPSKQVTAVSMDVGHNNEPRAAPNELDKTIADTWPTKGCDQISAAIKCSWAKCSTWSSVHTMFEQSS